MKVIVTEAPYLAKGDGITNDRAAIQRAIDDVHTQGGGTVVLPHTRTYLSSNLIMKSNVELHIEKSAILLQSPDASEYVRPVGDGYEPCPPTYGSATVPGVRWSHLWYYNYPYIYALPGTHDFKITGRGVICMELCTSPETLLQTCPIGFYRVSNVEISEITITNYHGYAMMPFSCNNLLIRDLYINNPSHGNGDGICLMNCQDVRITGCSMQTSDDSVYIFSSYRDPRASQWWSSDEPQPSRNIEIDHNNLDARHCKAFGMILWGIECPDLEQVEVRNVYVHDNYFRSMGNWMYNPYTTKPGFPPVTNMRFENNKIDGIESCFFETHISDMNCYPSMPVMHNTDFRDGSAFWSFRGSEGSAGVHRTETPWGYIQHFEQGDAALYQGLYLKAGNVCTFNATVRSSGDSCQMFVRDLDTQELIAALPFSNTEWQEKTLTFSVPKDGNYHIGIERGDASAGWAGIRAAELLGNPGPDHHYPQVRDEKYDKLMYLYPEVQS